MYDLLSGRLAAYALNRGGSIHPITIPKEVLENETGIMNPSIFNHNGRLLLNVRHVNYILYHSETKKFPHQWGPLVYVHPEKAAVTALVSGIQGQISAGEISFIDLDDD